MEPSTTDSVFKIGDWVEVISDTDTHQFMIGLTGQIVYWDINPRVKFTGVSLEAGGNNVSSDIRKYKTSEIVMSKNAIVRNILNDL